VIEEALYPASGEGGHTFLYVEKRGRTTEQVARELARHAGVSPREVGYAGRKDRHALTRQWFSLPNLDPERACDLELCDARVLEARRHGHKLRTGQLRANRFEIVLRGEGDRSFESLLARRDELVRRGLPNRYGEQRFGRDGDNAARARALLAQRRPPRDRRAARFLVSALQSEVFNAVLDARGDAFDRVELGDLARVEESGGLFWVDDVAREAPRAEAFEISATGPIFGTRMRQPRDGVEERERMVFEAFGVPEPAALKLPRGIRARGGRRPLRVRPVDLELAPLVAEPGLILRCVLPPGAYVTVLLDALLGTPPIDAHRMKERTDEAPSAAVSLESDRGSGRA
jgi:tRNA pseudouridine13 synthase